MNRFADTVADVIGYLRYHHATEIISSEIEGVVKDSLSTDEWKLIQNDIEEYRSKYEALETYETCSICGVREKKIRLVEEKSAYVHFSCLMKQKTLIHKQLKQQQEVLVGGSNENR